MNICFCLNIAYLCQIMLLVLKIKLKICLLTSYNGDESMSKIAKLIEQFDLQDGFIESSLPKVRFFKSSVNLPRMPLLYDPGICIVIQGHKIGYLGDYEFKYDPDNYLVISLTTPFECATYADNDAPLYGIYIEIDMPLLHELIALLGKLEEGKVENSGLFKTIGPAKMEPEMEDALARLLKCLLSPTESQILGPGLVKEILFRVLNGVQAPLLYALAAHDGHFASIARSLRVIHKNYSAKLDVDQLANSAGMSISSFHRAFKEVTAESPIQYLKKIRLSKAKEMMINEKIKAYLAADSVGYESVSQFSREFKRYFGQSPAEVLKGIRSTI